MSSKAERNIAIIGASYLQLPLIEKAKRMGYITHVFAWAANDVGEATADYFYPISIVEKEKILDECRRMDIVGICSIGSDLAMHTVNYVGTQLGLTCNSISATEKSTNKHLMRIAFEKNGDPSPKSIIVDESSDLSSLGLNFPIIVKPTDRSGSRGIFKLEDAEGLKQSVSMAIEQSFEKKALIEEFVNGEEYSVEYISYRGEHHFLAITQKFTTGAPHFIEIGHRQPAPLDENLVERIKRVITHALDSLELENGASHSEVKIDGQGTIRIIEIGGRMGGDCIGSDLVQYSTGVDFVRAVIDVACGKEPDLSSASDTMPVAVRFIFDDKDIEKMKELRNEGRLLRIVDYHPERIGHITDSSNRAGCYIYRELKM